ncbi:nuclear transport factor 2 family protein [Amycolatopsis sp. NBC_00355]|uniref:nuclear transport factor 2 family protein n=1 Tax=Amycolatopsis sp. NBC_00355 TaxID=2975957 RepID=UPI002E2664B5
MSGAEDLLLKAYAAYNRQDADGLLELVSDDVDWPDGANRLHGKAELKAYWLDQWTRTRTHDQPLAFTAMPDGRVAVRIGQVVRSLDGRVLSRGSFGHVHDIVDSRIARLDIEKGEVRGAVRAASSVSARRRREDRCTAPRRRRGSGNR